MNLVPFDLEILKIMPENEKNFWLHSPLGISCGAALCDNKFIQPELATAGWSRDAAAGFVGGLQALVAKGYTLCSWNGAAFDFRLLAETSGLKRECVALMWDHIDPMFNLVCLRGHYLGLNKAAHAVGGAKMPGVTGATAPLLWSRGCYTTVEKYMQHDVLLTKNVVDAIFRNGGIRWFSGESGQAQFAPGCGWTVKEALTKARHIPGWVKEPVDPLAMLAWAM